MANVSRWKDFEREVANDFGTERTPLSGGNSKHTRADTLHSMLFIECKKRKNHALHKLFNETAKLAKREGKLPVVATRETGKRGYLLTMRPEDLEEVVRWYKSEEDK